MLIPILNSSKGTTSRSIVYLRASLRAAASENLRMFRPILHTLFYRHKPSCTPKKSNSRVIIPDACVDNVMSFIHPLDYHRVSKHFNNLAKQRAAELIGQYVYKWMYRKQLSCLPFVKVRRNLLYDFEHNAWFNIPCLDCTSLYYPLALRRRIMKAIKSRIMVKVFVDITNACVEIEETRVRSCMLQAVADVIYDSVQSYEIDLKITPSQESVCHMLRYMLTRDSHHFTIALRCIISQKDIASIVLYKSFSTFQSIMSKWSWKSLLAIASYYDIDVDVECYRTYV